MTRLSWWICVGGLAILSIGLDAPVAHSAARTKEEEQRDSEARLKKDIFFLASEKCEGRGPNTKGINLAADHIAAEFKKAGLKPANNGSYFQPFTIPGAKATLALEGPEKKILPVTIGTDFTPLGMDQSGKAQASLVFAGYGITCKDPAYDDYDDLDVKDKIVIVLRDTPRANQKRTRELQMAGSIASKLALAKKNGAAGLILVNDTEAAGSDDTPMDYSYTRSGRGGNHIPAVMLRRDVVEKMFPKGKTLAGIEAQINKDFESDRFLLDSWTARIEVERSNNAITLKNVIGVLEGAGPLAKETVVVGSHYDHLGYGSMSSLAGTKKRLIHFGADDNGSGTTSMMELARRFAAMPNRQGRRMLFMAFSGEEIALLGSAYYCNNPLFPLADTAAMYNLDMVGRASKDTKSQLDKLLTEGHGTAKPFKEMIDTAAKEFGFTLTSKASGFGPSDHASFCSKKIPVLFVWTGIHADYHRPTDTPDKINIQSMRRIVDMSEKLITTLTKMDKPAFVTVAGGGGGRPSTGPRLGLRPAYSEDVKGLKVEGVIAGGPAERGGVKDNDVIVSIAGKDVTSIETYLDALAKQKPGSTIEVIVQRAGKKVTLKIKLD